MGLLGAGLVVLGGLVYLRLRRRPGERLAWLGIELTSPGAGTPVAVLGALLLVAAALDTPTAAPPPPAARPSPVPTGPTPATGCFVDFFKDLPPGQVTQIQNGIVGQACSNLAAISPAVISPPAKWRS